MFKLHDKITSVAGMILACGFATFLQNIQDGPIFTVWNRYATYNFFVYDEWRNKFISLITPTLGNNSC